MQQNGELNAAAPAALRALVASSVPGRVRLRGAALRSTKMLARLHEALQDCEGVTACSANARVGSVLLRYEPARLPLPELLARLAEALPPAAREAATAPQRALDAPHTRRRAQAARRRRVNAAVQCGMALSLGASLLAAATGATRAHVLAGCMFTALLAQHLYTWRRPLLRPLGISVGAR